MGDRDGTETATQTELESPTRGSSPDEAQLLPTILGDRYQIEGRLGAGGMGVVYAAQDIHLGRRIAIKLVGPRIDSAGRQGRLEREAQAMAKLRHPNIATVHDIGAMGDRLFVVMELVDGGTLADWLGSEHRSWRQVIDAFLQAARGLGAAHAAGFVHRDFKPENVLIGKDGVARVSDFGVARLVSETELGAPAEDDLQAQTISRTGGVVGTPGYIAPEIVRHEPADARADQFSFCVALYAALQGERPFEALQGPSRIAETLGALRPARSGAAPRWLNRMIVRGLAKDARDRWPSMAELTAAIEGRLSRRRLGLVLGGVGATAVAALAVVMLLRAAPELPPDLSPFVLKRQTKDSPFPDLVVSRDGSTVVSFSSEGADVEPRINAGSHRRVVFPPPLQGIGRIKSSHTGDRLFGAFVAGKGNIEIWAIDVATNVPRRLVPSARAPTLYTNGDFDVGADESLVLLEPDGSALWRVDASGDAERLLTASAGEEFMWPVWSPDDTRIAFGVYSPSGVRTHVMNTETHAVSSVPLQRCGGFGPDWLTPMSLVCTPWSFRNVVVVEKFLSSDGNETGERIRYRGPEYQRTRGLHASATGILIVTAPSDRHLGLLDLDAPGKMRRISLDSITDLPAVGWTSSGSLIFGANIQGHLRIMAMRSDGSTHTVHAGPLAELPLVVLGETIVFGRFPGGESIFPFAGLPEDKPVDGELYRMTLPDGTPQPLGKTSGFQEVICAGGGASPCLLAERSGDEVLAVDWDPETGARGRLRARWSVTWLISALSFDGRTLAQVRYPHGDAVMSFLELETGERRTIDAQVDTPRWLRDGTLLAMGAGKTGLGLVRIRGLEKVEMVWAWDDAMTRPGPFQVSPDGKTAAMLLMDESYTYWWADPGPRP